MKVKSVIKTGFRAAAVGACLALAVSDFGPESSRIVTSFFKQRPFENYSNATIGARAGASSWVAPTHSDFGGPQKEPNRPQSPLLYWNGQYWNGQRFVF